LRPTARATIAGGMAAHGGPRNDGRVRFFKCQISAQICAEIWGSSLDEDFHARVERFDKIV
jgi:hypothetical protein